jgi:hypothetical protein
MRITFFLLVAASNQRPGCSPVQIYIAPVRVAVAREIKAQLRIPVVGLMIDSAARSVRDADALHQIVEPRIAVQTAEVRRYLQKDEERHALLKCLFEPFESRIFLA